MVLLDLRKFSIDRLHTKNGRRDALAHLSAVLATSDTCINQVVTNLLSVPNLFPYLCSGELFVRMISRNELHKRQYHPIFLPCMPESWPPFRPNPFIFLDLLLGIS